MLRIPSGAVGSETGETSSCSDGQASCAAAQCRPIRSIESGPHAARVVAPMPAARRRIAANFAAMPCPKDTPDAARRTAG
ncbi:hypothetical protein [Paenibacillus sp. GCM10027626]|uniref:hypothetical protein n=1 Tax=Paenibacillus sp. GCM10027626 TaxID=3273411 RepID=UPI0036D41997